MTVLGDPHWIYVTTITIPCRPISPNVRAIQGIRANLRTKRQERDLAQLLTQQALKGNKLTRAHVTIVTYRKRLLDPFAVHHALKHIQDGFCLGACPPLYDRRGKRLVGAWDGPNSPLTFEADQSKTTGPERVEITINVPIGYEVRL